MLIFFLYVNKDLKLIYIILLCFMVLMVKYIIYVNLLEFLYVCFFLIFLNEFKVYVVKFSVILLFFMNYNNVLVK